MTRPRVAVVTGAADGLGKCIAETFGAAGDRVGLLDVDPARLAATCEAMNERGIDAFGVTTDVADAAQVESAVAAVLERWGRIDVAVSNAGIAPHQAMLEMSAQDWNRVLDINLNGSFYFVTAVARSMVELGIPGAICCIASGAAFSARLGAGHYCTSKAGMVMLAKSLALEVGRRDIRVNVVTPGFIDHGFREGLGDFVPGEYVSRMRADTPMRRVGEAQDIADAVSYLCSDQAAFVSGAVLDVDGANSAGRFSMPWS
jgi:3-oxoacyl-[acyl-carrier protein] reductase